MKDIWTIEVQTTHEDMLSPYAWHIDDLNTTLKRNASMVVDHIDASAKKRRESSGFGWEIVGLAYSLQEASDKAHLLRDIMRKNRKDYHVTCGSVLEDKELFPDEK